MPRALIIVLVILVILIATLVVLYILGRRSQKKQAEQQQIMEANKQTYTVLIIDKKKMRMKDSGLPQTVINQTSRWARRAKFPIIKAKVGPRVMSFICDGKVYDIAPIKKEVKAVISGIYIMDIKGIHGNLPTQPAKKKGRFRRALESAQEKAGATPLRKKKK